MCGGAAIWGAAMCGAGAAMCGAGAAIRGGAEMCGMAGAACGIAGAGRAAAGGGPPRPPCGGSAIAAAVESARTETADIAARRKCGDMTKLRNETFGLKCAHGRPRSASDREKSPRRERIRFRGCSRNRHQTRHWKWKSAPKAGINPALSRSLRRRPIRGPMERAR